jgi:hypothetical protein
MVATAPDEELEGFLTRCGVAWSVISSERHVSLTNEWEALYGNCFSHQTRMRQGAKAQYECSQQSAETFMIVPFLGNEAGPHSINKPGPRKAAYQCHGDGTLPDLSAFAETDFFISPADLSWTMIHTHEDYAFGGPYFLRKDWLGAPRRGRARKPAG